jgi:ABC-type multidrug transport system ATPase subunit
MSEPAIRYQGVSFSYAGPSAAGEAGSTDRLVLSGVTFDVREGECLGVLGPTAGANRRS